MVGGDYITPLLSAMFLKVGCGLPHRHDEGADPSILLIAPGDISALFGAASRTLLSAALGGVFFY